MRRPHLFAAGLCALALAACQGAPRSSTAIAKDARLACYQATDELLGQHSDRQGFGRVLVATLVDINDVSRTSMFGRQMSEYLASRLTQRDVDVIHATVRQDHMQIRGDGQFLLSREVRNLAADHNARTVLVGTYGMVKEDVLVSVKLVSTVDDATLAAYDFALPRKGAVEDMLGTSSGYW
jgi:TolB-like protein